MSLIQELWKFKGGLKLESRKNLSNQKPIAQIPAESRYVVALQQHIGASAELIVNAGDRVLKGQMLASPKHLISAAVHSPVSGSVIEVSNYPVPHPSGMSTACVVIENDFQDEWISREPVGEHYHQMTSHDLRKVIRDAGIVGLGGAAFPSAVKQTEVDIHTLIINGVECEPYITCDDVLMRERAQEILSGADIIGHIIKAKECIIAIEDNKPEAISAMQIAVDDDGTGFFRVCAVPTIYPSGGEKQLIQVVTGKEVPVNGLPADVDILCQNVGTAYAIHKAVFEDEPLISRIVSVTGSGVKLPQNLEVPIGTSIKHCIEFCGGYSDQADHLIMGGPMMGFTLDSDQLPVIKSTNCLLLPASSEIQPANTDMHMPCIRCGRCVDVCPANLLPQQLYWYSSARNYERTIEYHLFDCIECGCCTYVCPSQIPLVQYYQFAKSEIWQQEHDRKKSDIARERYEQRILRLDRQKAEREERLRKKHEMLNKKRGKSEINEIDKKKDAIAAALERINEKKKKQSATPKNTDNLTPEQLQKIEEVERRRRSLENRLDKQ